MSFALPETGFFQKRKKRRRLNWKLWFWGGIFIFFVAGSVYFFVFSSVFKIKEIKIIGNNLISSEQVLAVAKNVLQEKILKVIPRDTIYVLVDKKISQQLFDNFPEIASIEVKMANIGRLDILVSERKTAAIVCQIAAVSAPSPTQSPASVTQISTSSIPQSPEPLPESSNCFFADEKGIVYRQSPEISGTMLPTFYEKNIQLQPRVQAVQPQTIQFAAEIKKRLREINIDLIGFKLDNEIVQELKSFTSEKWLIYFDMSRPAMTQVGILSALLKDEIKDKRAKLQYVDLRVENRVYYK